MMNNLLIIIDGSYCLYRTYYSIISINKNLGESSGAIYGVLNIISYLLTKYRPSHVVITFDKGGKTFRNNLYNDYKCNRNPMPDNLRKQITPLKKLIKAIGISTISITGVEGDDVIGTIALSTTNYDINVIIVSNDKDMAQLVSNKVKLLIKISGNVLGPNEIKDKFGVSPNLIIDYLALVGDRIDNIPGVPGIGVKTARLLLNKLGNLKLLYTHLDKINNGEFYRAKKIISNLLLYRENAFLSYKLATIKTNVPIKYSYHDFILKQSKLRFLSNILKQYNLYYFTNKLKFINF
ncbi:MAG: hypothetical protein N4P94_02150 [Candidatus Lightella neohaematopini]|nr:hypothetical protein [Candidatus Lightella neohaematopini]